jgi:hypothetical protein
MTNTIRAPRVKTTLAATILIALAACGSATAFQVRDHLTPAEIDQVKDAQALDKRIDVFIKAADRRMQVLGGGGPVVTDAKQLKKDSEIWGELPSGSRAELIGDIAGIFNEAITNIDDVSARNESNPLIASSLRKLAAAATRMVEQLKPAEAHAEGDAELNNFDQLTEYAESILQAANKLPPAPPPAEKKGKKT